jgi:hypothetical protein
MVRGTRIWKCFEARRRGSYHNGIGPPEVRQCSGEVKTRVQTRGGDDPAKLNVQPFCFGKRVPDWGSPEPTDNFGPPSTLSQVFR